tara:strand:- start:21 stop:542 length:522 start_codon:yes stop_codon:yes gene_type:complete
METCAICLEPMCENITTTNCNHKFCSVCFEELMDNNKIDCPLCRATITEYSNNDGKVRVLIKINSPPSTIQATNEDLNTRLITRNEIRKYNMRNYVYSILILYMCYSYINCSLMVDHTKNLYEECERINENITNTYNNIFDGNIPITLYDFETNHMSKICMLPTYFYNKCFNL